MPLNFKQLIEHRAAQAPDRLGYRFLPSDRDEMCLTYGQLARRASSLADELRRLVPAGQRALLLYPAGFDFICAFFACLLADVVAVPLPVPQADNGTERLEHVIRDCSPAIILTHSGILTRIQALLPPPLQQTVVATDVQPDWRHAAVSPDKADASLALLQYTSGSTGRPKGVCVSHENLHANLQQIEQAFGHSSDSRGVIWLPHYHDMGLIGGVLQPLFVGFPVTLFSPIAFVQRPVRWLQAIHTYRATTSGGPNFAYDLCVHKAASLAEQDLDLSCWTVAFNGAEPVKATTLDAFVSAFSPAGFRRSAFLPCYGLAEATLLVTASERNSEPVLATSPHMATSANIEFTVDGGKPLVSCGVAAAGVSVHIAPVDGSGHSAPGEIGEIVVQGPNVSRGYWDAVRTPPSGPHVSPLRTGDLGFLLDSRLYVTGRLTDLILSLIHI